MKFSVAPESNSAIVSALLDLKCVKMRSVIDFRFEINTSWSQYRLSRANLIRLLQNPPALLHTSGWRHPSGPRARCQTSEWRCQECSQGKWHAAAGTCLRSD